MINLLPPMLHRELLASRTNSLLLKYVFLLIALIGLMIVELAVVYIFLTSTKAAHQASIEESRQQTITYDATRQESESFRSNLAVAK